MFAMRTIAMLLISISLRIQKVMIKAALLRAAIS